MEDHKNKAPTKSKLSNIYAIRLTLAALALTLAACGGGGGGGTPRPTWIGCKDVTPRAPFIVSAAEATESLGRLLSDPEVDLSCVATLMPITAATNTPSR